MNKLTFIKRKYGKELLLDIYPLNQNLKEYANPFTANYYELIFIQNGQANFILESESISIKPNRIIFAKPYQQRKWLIKGEIEGFSIIFEKNFLDNFFKDDLFLYRLNFFSDYKSCPFLDISEVKFKFYNILVKEILAEIQVLKDDSNHIIRSTLYYLLAKLTRDYSNINAVSTPEGIRHEIILFNKLLEQNITSKHRVEDYSKLLKISRSRLNKIIKHYYNQSAKELIKNRIIQESIKYILYSTKSISEIAYNLNFSDTSNFNRFFKNHTGITPKQYRNEYLK